MTSRGSRKKRGERGEKIYRYDEELNAWITNKRRARLSEDVKELNVLVLDLDYDGKFAEEELKKFAEFLASLEENGIDFNLAFSGGGFYLYVLLESPVKASEWGKYQLRFIALGKKFGLPVDDRVKDPARVMRLIGTINWKYEEPKPTFWIKDGTTSVNIDDLEAILPSLAIKVEKRRRPFKCRELSEEAIEEISEALKDVYVDHHRHNITIGLLGILVKANVCKGSSEALFQALFERANVPESKRREHWYQINYHYSKERGKLKGWGFIEDEIREVKGEEWESKAIEVKEVLRKYGLLNSSIKCYDRGDIKVCNDVDGVYVVREGKKRRVRVKVLDSRVVRIEYVYDIGLYGITSEEKACGYKIAFECCELGPARGETLFKLVEAEHLAVSNRYTKDVINALIRMFKPNEVKLEAFEKGIWYDPIKGEVIFKEIPDLDEEKLSKAVETFEALINLFREQCSNCAIPFVASVIHSIAASVKPIACRIGVPAPRGLYLHGERKTGKDLRAKLGLTVLYGKD